VNRNDLATWLILASPLAASYAMARVGALSGAKGRLLASAEQVVDSRMAAVVASLCLMLALLLATMSRSGIVGCAAGLVMLLALGRPRVSTGQFLGLLAGLVLAGAVAAAYVSLPMLTARFSSVFADDVGRGRVAIWRQVWPLARDFWRTGVGVGAFERGMLVYEKRPFDLFINQAHDEYLQVLVEGGAPLVAAAVFSIVVAWREARRRLLGDTTPAGWLRAGALSGATAVAVQSIWDTGLRMPANAVLFAVLASIALHERSASFGSTRPADRA
jgi:O-antigen ligase